MLLSLMPKAKRHHIKKQHKLKTYRLIRKLHEEEGWSITFMCRELGISRAAYYKWVHHKPSDKDKEDERIVQAIREISQSNNSLFGCMKMFYVLRNKYHFTCGHNRVYRLMCINDIRSNFRRRARYHYKSSTPEETAENVLNRNFNASRPNEKWVNDITEIRIPGTNQKLYISPIIDLYDRYPVALSVSGRNDTLLIDDVLEKAHEKYPSARPLFHDDRGFQYTRKVFQAKLDRYGMTHSMSRVSKCIDNGPCEQFQGLFKDMLFTMFPDIETKEEMIEAIDKTLDYYINEYPQERFKGKTCGEVRKEALSAETPVVYPIKPNKKIEKYWADIEAKKKRQAEETIEAYKQTLK